MGRNGVFSFARYDSPDGDGDLDNSEPTVSIFEKNKRHDHLRYVRLLKKAVKVMGHELCHCFGLKHCTNFNCVMQGSNNANEAGRKFHELCPCCLRKTFYAVEFEPVERYERLKAWIDNLIETNPAIMSESESGREINYYEAVFGQWSAWYGRRIEAIRAAEARDAL